MTETRRWVLLRAIVRTLVLARRRAAHRIARGMTPARRRGLRQLARRLAPGNLLWVDSALDQLRRELPADGLRVRLPDAPGASGSLTGVAELWLRARRATCLERALVMQGWLLALGEPHLVLIGVAPESARQFPRAARVMAHAWLDNEDPQGHEVVTQVEPAVKRRLS